MKSVIDQKDRQFLDRLQRLGGGTIQEICDDQGVTATAVRQRLTRLQAIEFVSRVTKSEGRGRPYHVYQLTKNGLRELGENYTELAAVLWKAILQIDDVSVRKTVLASVQSEMVRRYGRSVEGQQIGQRIDELSRELSACGFSIEVDHTGELPILREKNCPYIDLVDSDSEICQLEQDVYSEILGESVELLRCSHDGVSYCEFHLKQKVS